METVVLDTDIIINHARGAATDLSTLLLQREKGRIILVVPSIVVFEYYSGAPLKNSDVKIASDFLFSQFIIQEVTLAIAHKAAELNRMYTLYKKIDTGDILIGATALVLNGTLATRNKKHFQHIPSLKFHSFL